MKPKIYLDPFVFACPSAEEGLSEFELYINNIIAWSLLKDNNWIPLYLSGQTVDILFETNRYPLWDDLKVAISYLDLQDIQPQDVITIVNGLLLNLPSIESIVGISEVLLSEIQCIPSDHLNTRQPIFINQYQRLLAFMSLVCILFEDRGKDQILITRQICKAYMEISVAGQIVDAQMGRSTVNINIPCDLSNEFSACSCPDGLYIALDPINIWMNSESAEDYNKSIYVCLYQTLFNAGIKDLYIRDYKWKFGSKFFQTAEAHGFLKQEKKIKILLRACVEVILKENMGYAHWLRVGKGANDPQKQRGDNKAWRRDIDYEYHLHYWEAERGQEFASIVVHNDMSIPE